MNGILIMNGILMVAAQPYESGRKVLHIRLLGIQVCVRYVCLPFPVTSDTRDREILVQTAFEIFCACSVGHASLSYCRELTT